MTDQANGFSIVLAAADNNDAARAVTIVLIIAAGLIAVALVTLVISTLVSVARSVSYSRFEKVCWAVLVLFFPLVGSLGWFAVGRRMRDTPEFRSAPPRWP